MRRTVIALILLVAVAAAQTATADAPAVSLSPIGPEVSPTLGRRIGESACGDAAAILAQRQSITGDMAPPGYEPGPAGAWSGERCDLVCPPCAYVEQEPWCEPEFEDTYNGGCNSSPYVFETVVPYYGTITICGTSGNYMYGGSTYRDTDWYEVVVTEATDLVFRCIAEFPLQMILMNGTGGCLSYETIELLLVSECEEGVISAHVGAGTYWLWVGPSAFEGYPCDSDYIITLEGYYAARDCAADCPPGSMIEGEPTCLPDYEDTYNGGCNFPPYVLQPIEPSDSTIFICGEGGVYNYYEQCYRDMDWYELVLDEPRHVDFCGIAGFEFLFTIGLGGDCGTWTMLDSWYGLPCDVACASYDLEPGTYWLIFTTSVWTPLDCGRSYIMTIDGYSTPVEKHSWGALKALYR